MLQFQITKIFNELIEIIRDHVSKRPVTQAGSDAPRTNRPVIHRHTSVGDRGTSASATPSVDKFKDGA